MKPPSGLRCVGVALAVAVTARFTASASANHIFPATYTGTLSSGSSLDFQISDDARVVKIGAENVPSSCIPGTTFGIRTTDAFPIVKHMFGTPGTSFSGAFPAPQKAAGSLSDRAPIFGQFPPCTETVSWTATTTARDERAPTTDLTVKDVQKAGPSIAVLVSCVDEACQATATGTVSVPGIRAARRYKLKPDSAQIAEGAKTTLRAKVPRKVQTAINSAIRKRKKVKAALEVTVRDKGGNSKTEKIATIRLR